MSIKTHTTRGVNMPQYSIAKGENTFPKRWIIRRVGWRGAWPFCKFMTWLSGDELKLDLVIQSDSSIPREYDFTWQLIRRLPDTTEETVEQEAITITAKQGKTRERLKTYLFQYEDEYRLFTQLSTKDKTHQQTLLNFTVLARDVWYSDWERELAIGFVGAILGLVAGLLLSRIN